MKELFWEIKNIFLIGSKKFFKNQKVKLTASKYYTFAEDIFIQKDETEKMHKNKDFFYHTMNSSASRVSRSSSEYI